MAAHNDFGKKAEDLSVLFLLHQGYNILQRNWRYSYYEIDIIAEKDNILHFVEVKARSSSLFGYPEESVTEKKIHNLMRASEVYIRQSPEWKQIQFDILSILTNHNKQHEYYFIEDVYI